MSEIKNIGVDVKAPTKTCQNDKHCPFHGSLSLRGRTFVGKVLAAKMPKNATVVWERQVQNKKYERFQKKQTKIVVHNPMCIDAKPGDIVKIMECRKISKIKSFVIIEKLNDQSQSAKQKE